MRDFLKNHFLSAVENLEKKLDIQIIHLFQLYIHIKPAFPPLTYKSPPVSFDLQRAAHFSKEETPQDRYEI